MLVTLDKIETGPRKIGHLLTEQVTLYNLGAKIASGAKDVKNKKCQYSKN